MFHTFAALIKQESSLFKLDYSYDFGHLKLCNSKCHSSKIENMKWKAKLKKLYLINFYDKILF